MSRYSQMTTTPAPPAGRAGDTWPTQPLPYTPTQPGVYRETPTRALSVKSDVGVPLLWALISGLLVGAGLWYASNDLESAMYLFGTVTLIAWPLGIWVVIRTLTAHERPDERPPVIITAPAEQKASGKLVINGGRGRAEQRRSEREEEMLKFRTFLIGCEQGHTDVRYWQGVRDAAGGRVIGETDYYDYRKMLMRDGDAAWDNPNNHAGGWHLTRPAEAIYQDVDYWDNTDAE